MDSIVEQRYNGLTDQIDFYFWLHNDNGILSSYQKQHLTDLKNTICVFGKRANKWINLANKLLNDSGDYEAGKEAMKEKAIESYIENCEYKSDWCCGCAEAHGAILAEPDVCMGKDCPYVKGFIEKLNS